MSSSSGLGGSRANARLAYRGYRMNSGVGDVADPFAINPIRRSFVLVTVSSLIVFGSLLIGGTFAATVMLAAGWLAITGIVMGVPILCWSLAEEGWRLVSRRVQPSVEQLDLPPRVIHILIRHGYESISEVDRTPDATLLLLSNMDQRGLREMRRAISLWQYRWWQERGFPDG